MAPLPTAPVTDTWPLRTSSQVFADDMNTELANAVTFLTAPPAFAGRQLTSAQSIPNNADTNVALETILYDNYSGFNDNTFKKWTVPAGCAGVYLALGGVAFNAGSTTSNFIAKLNVNNGTFYTGSAFPSAASSTCAPIVADLLILNDGDTVAIAGNQNTGVSQNVVNTNSRAPYLNLCWVSKQAGTSGITPVSPRTWAANDLCTSTGAGGNFNNEIRNAVRFLAFPPFCRVGQSSAQTGIGSGADVHITGLGPGTGFDNYSAYNTGTDIWTCPVTGTYLIGAQVAWSAGAGASYATMIKATVSSVATTYHLASGLGQANTTFVGARQLRMTAGDTVQLFGRQNSGGGLNTVAANTRMWLLWRST